MFSVKKNFPVKSHQFYNLKLVATSRSFELFYNLKFRCANEDWSVEVTSIDIPFRFHKIQLLEELSNKNFTPQWNTSKDIHSSIRHFPRSKKIANM